MSKRPRTTYRRPAAPKQVGDFQLDSLDRAMIINGRFQQIPKALAFAQAEFVVSMRITDCTMIAEGSVAVPCVDCGMRCWRSPSSPKRTPLLCTVCCAVRVKRENAN